MQHLHVSLIHTESLTAAIKKLLDSVGLGLVYAKTISPSKIQKMQIKLMQ